MRPVEPPAEPLAGPLLPGRAGPAGRDTAGPGWPESPLAEVLAGPRVIVVRNDDDGTIVRGYLKRFYDLRYRRPQRATLVRPTPGATDRATLALDVLVGLYKNPQTLAGERLGGAGWDYARAWLAAGATSDLVVDRAHQLVPDRVADLAELGAWSSIRVWLIWSGGGDLDAAVTVIRAAGLPVDTVMPHLLRPLLPLPAHERSVPFRFESRTLPTAEFTTFRAACRRLLSPREFDHVDALYLDAATRTDLWLTHHERRDAGDRQRFGAALATWLRDSQLGPHADPGTALITLRATQAALFIHGVLLRWDPATLGPEPAARLCGTIDVRRAPHDLYAGATTAAAAITALSLHLNQPPHYFGCWRVRHAAVDGATLTAPAGGDHRHDVPAYLHHDERRAAIETSSGVEEIPCAHTVALPEPMQVILAAHRAYRLLQGATEHDPLFDQGQAGMRETAWRTATHLHRVPPWLHRDPCRYGGDIGLRRRVFGWLVERGLSVHLLDADVAAQLHHPLHHRGEP